LHTDNNIATTKCRPFITTQLYVHDNVAEDWRIAMTMERVTLMVLELAAVAVHPYPTGLLAYIRRVPAGPETELEIMLALPMFFRLYLLGRAIMLHSRLFTDTASRSIGALNKVRGRPVSLSLSLSLSLSPRFKIQEL